MFHCAKKQIIKFCDVLDLTFIQRSKVNTQAADLWMIKGAFLVLSSKSENFTIDSIQHVKQKLCSSTFLFYEL